VHDREVLGRVWVIRHRNENDSSPETTEVTAFSTLCPHLGCAIQLDAKGNRFVCPCHKAAFKLDGNRDAEADPARKNHAPRGMDSLDCHLVQDATSNEWWVEVTFEKFEQGLTQKVRKA
jgi:Rieske Fe-S protein